MPRHAMSVTVMVTGLWTMVHVLHMHHMTELSSHTVSLSVKLKYT